MGKKKAEPMDPCTCCNGSGNQAVAEAMNRCDETEAFGVNYFGYRTPDEDYLTPREDLLREAIGLITRDRNNSYGPPTQDFQRTAALLNAFGFRFVAHDDAEPVPLLSHQVAIIQNLLKTSRLAWSPRKRDNWTDTAGYAGCGYECVLAEEAAENNAALNAEADDALDRLRLKLAGA